MLYIKALHIIFVITWFAGLFYIVRLFVYHSEANEKSEPEKSILIRHFKGAEKRLWYGITWPSAIGAYVFGIWTWNEFYGSVIPNWLALKLLFVIGLTIYHFICDRMVKEYRNDVVKYSGQKMRVWNEVATIFLVAIVFLAVMKDTTNWIYGVIGLILFSIVIMLAIWVYKRFREKSQKP